MSFQQTLNSLIKKGKNNPALVERLIKLGKGKRLTKVPFSRILLSSHQLRLYHSYNNNNSNSNINNYVNIENFFRNVNLELFDKSKNRRRKKDNDDDDDEIARDASELLKKMNKKFGNRKKGNDNNEDDDGKPLDWKNLNPKYYFYTALAFAFLISLVYAYNKASTNNEIDFDTFYNDYLRLGRVGKVVVSYDTAYVYLKDSNVPACYLTIGSFDNFIDRIEEAHALSGLSGSDCVNVIFKHRSQLAYVILQILPALLLGTLIYFSSFHLVMPKNPFRTSLTPNKLVSFEKLPNVKFDDVAGVGEAKVEIMEIISFLKNPVKYESLGARMPRGALLAGPPGTGKTLLAKATAGEAGVPFFNASGSDFVERFVGLGALRVRELFKKAREQAPCIIFIDEIDAIGKSRTNEYMSNDERDNTLNQLLVEMDGFNEFKEPVIILGGTNRIDTLDKALLRPGRFDRTITIDPPDKKGRMDIFKLYLQKNLENLHVEKLDDDYLRHLAELTPGLVGADIANICNEAALISARRGGTKIELADLESAIDRVVGGIERRSKVLDEKEKNLVAHHEAGHVVASWFLEYVEPLLKVSIIPRGTSSLGFTQYKLRDHYLLSREQLLDRMCMTLGGRAAEEIIFGTVSTGAEDDLKKVTNLAFDQITKYGFSKKIGLVSYVKNQSAFSHREYSEETSRLIDEEVRNMVNEAYERTKSILLEHKDQIIEIAQALLDKEKIFYEDIEKILGKRPFEPEQLIEKK